LQKKQYRRCLAFVLSLITAFTFAMSSAHAAEDGESESTAVDGKAAEVFFAEKEITSIESYEPDVVSSNILSVEKLQNRINAVLTSFSIAIEMTDSEIANAITISDSTTIENAITERDAINVDAMNLTQEQLLMLELGLYERFWNIFDEMYAPVPAVTVTGVDGVTVTVDSNGSISESGGTVTATVKGSYTTRKTTTITVTNTSGSTATISFNYSVSNHDSSVSTIDDLAGANSGSYSVLLTAGATKTFTMCSKRFTSNTTATATLSSFIVEAVAASSNVTINYNNLGSVTVEGEAAASGSVHSVDTSTGAILVATADSDAKFLAWINAETNAVITTAASYTCIPTEDISIKAVFASAASQPCFWGGGKAYLFEELSDATAYATSAADKTIVLAHDGTFTTGGYTIPSGVTMLIPYNDANTLCTTSPAVTNDALVAPTAYRTLTMAKGAYIIVNGGLSVSGTQNAAYPLNGQVTGAVGVIYMNDDSNITVNADAALYAWGYVAGTGTITIKSGGSVYEDFQVRDYRGGEVTSTLAKSNGSNVTTWHIFPMSQYYVQNVQVPMTLEAGAIEKCYFSVTASLMGNKSETIDFIGENSMFQISSGYITKDYDETKDRLIIDVHGNLEVNSFSIEIQVKFLSSSITINSSNYDLPLNSNITINLHDKSVVDLNQSLMLLPGSIINIGENTTLNVNSGKRLIVYDQDQWGLYCSDLQKAVVPLAYVFNGEKGAAPAYTRTTEDLVDAQILVNGTLDAKDGYLYTTEGGGSICSSGGGKVILQTTEEVSAYQIEQKRNGNDDFDSSTELDEYPITSAQLKNEAETSYVTTTDITEVTTYYYDHHSCEHDTTITNANHGAWYSEVHAVSTKTTATCTESGFKVETCTCGHEYQVEAVEALGHSWCDWTNKSTDDVPSAKNVGTQIRTCLNCPESEERNVFKIYGTSVKVGDSLELYFYIHKDVLNSDDIASGEYNAKLTRAYVDDPETDTKNDACEKETNISSNTWQAYGNYYRFCYSGIAAKEMMDEVKVVIYHNGEEVSIEATESIAGYAERTLAKYETKKNEEGSSFTEKDGHLQTVLVDMLNYGAACQTFFGYDASNLATKNISAYQGYASASMQSCSDADITGSYEASISAKNKLMYSFYIDSIVPSSAKVTYTDHYGNAKTPAVSVATTTKTVEGVTKTYYLIDVPGLAIADGRQPITCVVTDASGNNTTFTGSIQSFVAKKQALLEDADTTNDPKADEMTAYEMLIKFVDSARTYFGTAASNTAA